MGRKQERGRNRKERRKNEGRTSPGESETIVEGAEGGKVNWWSRGRRDTVKKKCGNSEVKVMVDTIMSCLIPSMVPNPGVSPC